MTRTTIVTCEECVRRREVGECAEAIGWVTLYLHEACDDSAAVGLDFCSWDCVAAYAMRSYPSAVRELTPGCDCDQSGNRDRQAHAHDCEWFKATR